MLTEQSAYSNRWRQVSPLAKGCFTLCGLVAASAAGSARTALVVAVIMVFTTLFGAGVAPLRYLRIAAPALVFLATSGISLAVSLDFGSAATDISLHVTQPELSRVALICSRSLACLTALLFLALTTPLPDIITVLRLCKVPDTLLDLMTLCYRTLFVLSETIHETRTAQAARLGHSTIALSLRSLGSLVTNLTIQVWQRSLALHYAAMARNNDGALRFLDSGHPHTGRHVAVAATAGSLTITLAALL